MSEKTEEPTPKRLRESREKGQVCKSQEVSATLGLLGVFTFFLTAAPWIWENLCLIFEAPYAFMNQPFSTGMPAAAAFVGSRAGLIVGLVLAVAITAGVSGTLIQIGVLFSVKAALPSLNKLNPANWFKKTFAFKNFLELAKTIIKTLVIFMVVKNTLEDQQDLLVNLPNGGLQDIPGVAAKIFLSLVLHVAPVFAAVAAIDYFLQRRIFLKDLRMTKDEVKREYKEMEGDPAIKGKRKQLHQEMAMSNTLTNVRKSSVVITNPTHVAVALYYEDGKTPLPVITGMGEGFLARRIVEVAREEGIPIMQNVPLARSLLTDGVENQYIPADLIRPVAEVLRWVQSLRK
jgi:type III secretion protein U